MVQFVSNIAVDMTNFHAFTSGQQYQQMLAIGGFTTFDSTSGFGFSAMGADVLALLAGPTGTVTKIDYGAGMQTAGVSPQQVLIGFQGLSLPAADALAFLTASSVTSLNQMASLLSGADEVFGSSFDDTLMGGAGGDVIFGGDGTDTVSYVTSSAGVLVSLAQITGLAGDANGDTLLAIENVTGSAHNDILGGSALQANVLMGGFGDDTLVGLSGADTLNGGAGLDTADYTGSSARVVVNLLAGTGKGGDAEGDTLIGIESVVGSGLRDVLFGDAGDNSLFGGDGDDYLLGGAGADKLVGGAGIDTVSYVTASALVVVELSNDGTGFGTNGDALSDQLSGIENIILSAFGDQALGNNGDNRILGLAGDDIVFSYGGRDAIDGGDGGDFLDGGDGNDALRGGDGDDIMEGRAGNDSLNGGDGGDLMVGGAGNDSYFVDSFLDEIAEATDGGTDMVTSSISHILSADVENLRLTGSAMFGFGNDQNNVIRGTDAANSLVGGGGADRLIGGDGDDFLVGEAGNDQLYGGAGNDTFGFTSLGDGVDRIGDWNTGDIIAIDLGGFGLTELPTNVVNGVSVKGAKGGDTDFFFYATGSGQLYFHDGDTDAFTQFATLSKGPETLGAGDFDILMS